MRMSARKWSVALMVSMGVAGSAAAQDKFSAMLSPTFASTIAVPQIISSSASRNVGVIVVLAVPQSVGTLAAIKNVAVAEPGYEAVKSIGAPRLDRMVRADVVGKKEATATADKGKTETPVASNPADDQPSSKQIARANVPAPTCR